MASNSAGIGGLLPPQTTDVASYILTTDGQTASWEVSSASLPSQGGNSGKFLTTDGSSASWGTPTGGVTTMAAVGSSPSANGASISSVTLTLQPADATHPGLITSGTQAIGGAKTFSGGVSFTGAVVGAANSVTAGTFSGYTGVWINSASPGFSDYTLLDNAGNMCLNGASFVSLMIANVAKLGITSTYLELSGMGNGGGIHMKSPDGTTYAITIANGGTLVIT